jgi:hypothetical protein
MVKGISASKTKQCASVHQKNTAEEHRELSRAIIMKLANSMPVEEPLRKILLSAPAICNLLDEKPLLAGSD